MNKIRIEKVVMRFSGDSGDGIQVIGNQISNSSVIESGNDIYTFVDFPAEIRAPAGSLSGVSGFQVSISSKKLYSIEDKVDLLVVLNPAALKNNIKLLKENGFLIIDIDTFNDKNLKRALYDKNPINDGSLDKFKVIKIPITKLAYECVKDILSVTSQARRCKNFFVLGVVCWLYDRSLNTIISWLENKFGSSSLYLANKKALKSGFNYGESVELLQTQLIIPTSGLYQGERIIKLSGNKAFSSGAMVSSLLLDIPLFSANYPITPASDIFHDLSLYVSDDIRVCQLEDEIASINAVIGASFGGLLSFTSTSGPGLDLMQEGLGLAIMSELPMVLLNIQRSGPSTGIPTKSEQTDLLASIFGRHGEANLIVLAPNSPADCFWIIIEGFILSIIALVPVIILSDANLANSSELWEIPEISYIKNKFCEILKLKNTKILLDDNTESKSKWIIPGDFRYKRCIGGLERNSAGSVSQDSNNHFNNVIFRDNKVKNVANYFSRLEVLGSERGKILIITWGSVFGLVRSIFNELVDDGVNISLICLRYLNPLPNDLENLMGSFSRILVIEENLSQLGFILRSKFLLDVSCINQVTGKPFEFDKLKSDILDII